MRVPDAYSRRLGELRYPSRVKKYVWLAMVVGGIVAALYFGRSKVETGTASRPWPLNLGKVADAPKHFPPTKDNEAALKLIQLASDAQVDLRGTRSRRGVGGVRDDLREVFTEHVRKSLEEPGDAIEAASPEVTRYLTDHAAALDAIRDLALSGQPIVFESDIRHGLDRPAPPEGEQPAEPKPLGPNIFGLQQLQRAFVARALTLARNGDPAAWNELRAAWELTRPLWSRPEPGLMLGASTVARMVNAAAGKMPLPAPAWLAELDTHPYELRLIAAQQAEAWREKNPGLAERLRGMAWAILEAKACDTSSEQFDAVREKLGARAEPNLVRDWSRFLRFRAEREARRNVLLLRSGQPPVPTSQCSDGSWEVTPTSFRFTREIKVEYPQIDYPLEYRKTGA
jgi:hypothetical protein